jgi:hypothetical protein
MSETLNNLTSVGENADFSVRPEHGFANVLHLARGEKYLGDAEHVILVWNEGQILPAEQYRKAWFNDKKVDICVCVDPNIQKEQIGKDKATIYNFSSQSSGGADKSN